MKILNIITNGLHTEGIATSQLLFMSRLDKSKINMTVAAVHNDDPRVIDEFKKIGCQVVKFPDRKKNTFQYFIALYNDIKRKKYDIVHVHGSSALLAIDLLAAKLAGTSVRIAHSRNTRCDNVKMDRLLRPIFNVLYTNAMACGEEAGKWLFGDREFIIMHNGKDFHDFCFSSELRTQERKALKLEDKLVIGHVGRFNEQKNHKYLLDVFSKIVDMREDAILYLMGDGYLYSEIQNLANTLGLSEKVIFAGSVSDVSIRLQAMDIMIFPSLFEGLPNVVLEWQAVGLPCLISDTITKECNLSDLVEYMPLSAGPDAWANKALEMILGNKNREENAKMAVDSLKKNGFDIEESAQKIANIYLSLVDAQKRVF